MPATTLEQELHAELLTLPVSKQREVLEFARFLNTTRRPVGVPGASLFPVIGDFDPAELTEMEKAIEEGCERIDINEW